MSRRKNLERVSAFDNTDNDLQAVADGIYGRSADDLTVERRVILPVPINQIVPDAAQPRRAMPSQVRQLYRHADEPTPIHPDVWLEWMYMAHREAGLPAMAYSDIEDQYHRMLLETPDDPQRAEKPRPLLASLLAVVDLAISIKRDGLAHPINISRGQPYYTVVTGERRWLAYNLLDYFGFDGFDAIPASVVVHDVWLQASENNARVDLNAISKARQYALLLMDLLREDGQDFQPVEVFDYEQQFYAQVVDARVPYGRAGDLLNAMGLKNRSSLKHYSDLLTLPAEWWNRGDDENMSRDDLLQIVYSVNNSTADAPDIDPDTGEITSAINNPNIPSAPSAPPAPPEQGRGERVFADVNPGGKATERWPKAGDMVVTNAGHVGQVIRVINHDVVQVKTRYRTGVFQVGTLRPAVEADFETEALVDDMDTVATPSAAPEPETDMTTPEDDPRDYARIAMPVTTEHITGIGWVLKDADATVIARGLSEGHAQALAQMLSTFYLSEEVQKLVDIVDFIEDQPTDLAPADVLAYCEDLREYIDDIQRDVQNMVDHGAVDESW